jgi:hypothetical protein
MKNRAIMLFAALAIALSSCQKGKDLPEATPVQIVLADGAKLQSNDLANHSENQLYYDLRNDLARFLENNNCYIVNENPKYIVEITKIVDFKTRKIRWFHDPCGPINPADPFGFNRSVVLDGYHYAAEVALYDANYNLIDFYFEQNNANQSIGQVGYDVNGCLDVNILGSSGGYFLFRTGIARTLRKLLTTTMFYDTATPQ